MVAAGSIKRGVPEISRAKYGLRFERTMGWRIMPEYESYEAARSEFSWKLPDEYNPAAAVARHGDRTALIEAASGERYSFADIDHAAGRLADALAALGIETGDRIGVIAPQRAETPIAHLAAWQLGAVTIPLTTMFGPEAIAYRLDDAEARAVVADPSVGAAVAEASEACPALETVLRLSPTEWYVGDPQMDEVPAAAFACEVREYDGFVTGRDPIDEPYASTPETTSAVMYTSGSTGPPKGVVHRHALWIGRAAAAYNFFDGGFGDGDVCWTPADWAWASALGGLLLGAWQHGDPVVAAPMRGFDPAAAYRLCARYDVVNGLAPPTALRMLMGEDPAEYELSVRTIATAGEPLTPEILDWAAEEFTDLTINEYYGQTELNLVIANASRWFPVRPGSMGKVLPGYEVRILDEETREPVPTGEVGELAIRPDDDRVFFAGYLDRPEATAAKRHDGWYVTDDLARIDEDGYVWFESRADDVIITSGYRVGPLEVESVLLDHPAVEQVGVIGVPDDLRGEVIKAVVEAAPGVEPDETLREELRTKARDRLAAYEYPREIEFVETLPKTATGKIRRVELRAREASD